MITAIAIDDEPNALGVIREYAKAITDLDLRETFTDPLQAEAWLHRNNDTGLIFLDIQMARMNGLELLRRNPDSKAAVILTTAYPNYALQGFDLDVADYLLKPFGMERFRQAMEKVRYRASPVDISPFSPKDPCSEEFIFIRTEYRIVKVSVKDIQYLEGTGNYVSIHLPSGRILSLQNMRSLEQMLKGCGFFRIHRSYIVAMRHVETVTRKSVTVAGRELPVGDSYREPFLEHIGSHYRLI
jgi:two-component system LytT family response regulator